MKLSAVRSPVRIDRAGPETFAYDSSTAEVSAIPDSRQPGNFRSTALKVAATVPRPEMTPSCFRSITPDAVADFRDNALGRQIAGSNIFGQGQCDQKLVIWAFMH